MTTAKTISLKALTQRGVLPARYSPWEAEPLNAGQGLRSRDSGQNLQELTDIGAKTIQISCNVQVYVKG
jgi:hypothetical protein